MKATEQSWPTFLCFLHCIFLFILVSGLPIITVKKILILDLQEGSFVQEQPRHPHFLEDKQAAVTSQLLKVMQPEELEDIKLNHDFRRNLLYVYETYYRGHSHPPPPRSGGGANGPSRAGRKRKGASPGSSMALLTGFIGGPRGSGRGACVKHVLPSSGRRSDLEGSGRPRPGPILAR